MDDKELYGVPSQFCIGYPDEDGVRSFEELGLDELDKFDAWPEVEYPKFFWWRFEQIFSNSEEFLEITPDMVDEYFKEPEDPLQTRCPRCLSINFVIGYPDMECEDCGWNEPRIDFPMSEGFYQWFERSGVGR